MKLLFDQNISFRFLAKLISHFPDSIQVRRAGLDNSTDLEIWKFAKNNNFVIVAFDSDFFELSNLYGHPPRIVWIRVGNLSTNELADFLLENSAIIKEFGDSTTNRELACLELLKAKGLSDF